MQVERGGIQAADRDEQELEMERRVVEVLVGFGEQEHEAARGVDREAENAPGNQPVHRGDRDTLRDTEQPQVERADAADQHAQAEEMNALENGPRPRRAHQTRHRRVGDDVRDEPDLEIVQHQPNAVSRL